MRLALVTLAMLFILGGSAWGQETTPPSSPDLLPPKLTKEQIEKRQGELNVAFSALNQVQQYVAERMQLLGAEFKDLQKQLEASVVPPKKAEEKKK